MPFPLWILAIASVLMIYTDLTTRRIPNRLILVALVCLIVNPAPCHATSFLIMIGVVILLPYLGFLIRSRHDSQRILGYGDIKLMLVLSLGLPLTTLPAFLMLSGLGGLLTFGLFRLFTLPPHPFPLGPALIIAFWMIRLETHLHLFLSFFRF